MEWTSIHAALPEPGETVLAWGVEGCSLARCVRKGSGLQDYIWTGVSLGILLPPGGMTGVQVSHWQHLPKPPEWETYT
jgi:hypothetical protein